VLQNFQVMVMQPSLITHAVWAAKIQSYLEIFSVLVSVLFFRLGRFDHFHFWFDCGQFWPKTRGFDQKTLV